MAREGGGPVGSASREPAPSHDAGSKQREKRICLVGSMVQNEELLLAARSFGLPVILSETGEELLQQDNSTLSYFILEEFEGSLYDTIHGSSQYRILGPTAVIQLWRQGETQLPDNIRPLYSLAMRNAYICFTGFRVREELTHLIILIHNMGGSIRKDMNPRVTHLVANKSGGEKYHYATTFRLPVIGREWVERFWTDRHMIDRKATDETLLKEYKLKVFLGAKVCFIGFSEEECQHMSEILIQNGGEVTNLEDPMCTHVVVANGESFDHSLSIRPLPDTSLKDISASCLHSSNRDNFKSEHAKRGFKIYEHSNRFIDDNDLENIPENVYNDDDLSYESDDSKLKNLYYTDEDRLSIYPSMTNEIELDSNKSKKRPRNSIDSNFEIDLTKIDVKPNRMSLKSPFKRLKLKESFKFKSKDKPFIQKKSKDLNSSICTISTLSPEKDEFDQSFSSVNSCMRAEKSFMSSSGIFDVSITSIQQCKTFRSKIRRSMKSITASFRGERKKKYERRQKDDLDTSDLHDFEHNRDLFSDVSPVLNRSPESPHLTNIIERSETNISANTSDQKDSDAIFKTPKSKHISRKRKLKRTLTDSPAASSPLSNLHSVTPFSKIVGDREATPFHVVHPKKRIPEVKLKSQSKIPLDCTMLSVVDEHNTQVLPDAGISTHIVRAEWFWTSIQNEEAQSEKDYSFEDYLDSQTSPSRRSSRGSLSSGTSAAGGTSPPCSSSPDHHGSISNSHSQRLRKRKLRGMEAALNKRRSSVGDAVLLSLSGNMLDCTQSPDGKHSILDEVECVAPNDVSRKHLSPRQQVFMELVQTETNYVGILHTIVTIFKQPLEEMSNEEDPSKALLNNTELKIIFGNLVPIYEIHRKMLEELKRASLNWCEEISIGRIILKYAPELVKAYPPFVNFFENMKEMLVQCDREKPRFHAFLKGRQTRPECGRQTLQELTIRPVQRLPSISLLLEDILKHTNKSNPDHSALESALIGIKEIMTYVNEDKRKTEGQLQMFDIYNEIDNCPAHLVSSHRSFVARCEVVELSKDLSGRGDHLVLFLFTDTMEVCKKRSKVFNSKSPPINGLHHATSKLGSSKSYRHVQLMPLSTIKRVIDIRESEECHKVFALMCRSNQELKEKLYSFAITEESVDKPSFLKQLCRQMANTVCKTDAEKFLACLDSHQLDIDTSDFNVGTLSKVTKFASRTKLKLETIAAIPWFRTSFTEKSNNNQTNLEALVGRAFSFNKTPSKLKRAVSSMISPFGSTSNLTPASQLAQMRLASCNNINELGGPNSGQSEALIAPMSVQPTRKAKAGTLTSNSVH